MANSTSRSVALLMYFSHNGFYSKILCSVAAAGVSLSGRLYFLHEILLVLTTAVLMVRKLGIPILLRIRECRTLTSSWNMWEVRYVTKSQGLCSIAYFCVFSSEWCFQRKMICWHLCWHGECRLFRPLVYMYFLHFLSLLLCLTIISHFTFCFC